MKERNCGKPENIYRGSSTVASPTVDSLQHGCVDIPCLPIDPNMSLQIADANLGHTQLSRVMQMGLPDIE